MKTAIEIERETDALVEAMHWWADAPSVEVSYRASDGTWYAWSDGEAIGEGATPAEAIIAACLNERTGR